MKNLIALFSLLCLSAAAFAASDEVVLRTDYYQNGNLKYAGYAMIHPEAGEIPHGYWQYFHPNGFLKSAGYFKEGYKCKTWTNFFENGSVESYGPYSKGMKDGRWHLFYKNGAKMAEGKFSDNLAKGTWTYWHTNGVLETEGDFKEGKRVGKRVYYDARGNKLWYGRFVDDEKEGEWRLDGKDKTTVATYKGGVLMGQREEIYYPNGDIKEKIESEVIFGQLTGSQIKTVYAEDEVMASQGLLFNGTPYGVWRYYENGKLEQKEMGGVPETLQQHRRSLAEAQAAASRRAAAAAQNKDQNLDPMANIRESQEPFQYGPRKFEVIMQPPTQMEMTVTTDSGRSIDLNENNYDVTKQNPRSFEALRQMAARAREQKAAEEMSEEMKEEE
ncbi:toxin-antitoxin system YwqK family antitoxin [bacterium]|nr:toxin-antitoxin system YwqK family antitoxin [bacterium]